MNSICCSLLIFCSRVARFFFFAIERFPLLSKNCGSSISVRDIPVNARLTQASAAWNQPPATTHRPPIPIVCGTNAHRLQAGFHPIISHAYGSVNVAATDFSDIFHFNPWNNKVFLTLFLSKSPGMCYHIVCGKEEPEPPRHHAGRSRSERQRTIL